MHGRASVVKHKPVCYCKGEVVYNDKHDAYYCKEGDCWLEGACSDHNCNQCKDRPEKPSQCLSDFVANT